MRGVYKNFYREVVLKASFQGFQTSFLDVLQTKFDPSTRGPVNGRASVSYCSDDTQVSQGMCPIVITQFTLKRNWEKYNWLN